MWHSLPRFDRSAMGTTNCGRAGLFEAVVRARRGPSVVGRKPHTKRLHYNCTARIFHLLTALDLTQMMTVVVMSAVVVDRAMATNTLVMIHALCPSHHDVGRDISDTQRVRIKHPLGAFVALTCHPSENLFLRLFPRVPAMAQQNMELMQKLQILLHQVNTKKMHENKAETS